MSYAIGIDLGGTQIKMVCVDVDGVVVDRSIADTDDDATTAWTRRVRDGLAELEGRRGRKASWIGLCAPGLVAEDGRSIAFMPGRLRGLESLDWGEFLGRSDLVPVLNDAHAALLGEVWVGATRGLRNVAMLTLGTGVGGAILADGQLLKGHIGRAGHLGHISLDVDKPGDVVGTPGSLEDAIGNSTLHARSGGRFHSTRKLVEAYRSGDAAAGEIWLRSVYELACGLASIINVLDPEAVILGGGIAQAGSDLFEPLDEFLEKVEWRPSGHRCRIVGASLGDRAGALGSAYNAIRLAGSPQIGSPKKSPTGHSR